MDLYLRMEMIRLGFTYETLAFEDSLKIITIKQSYKDIKKKEEQ